MVSRQDSLFSLALTLLLSDILASKAFGAEVWDGFNDGGLLSTGQRTSFVPKSSPSPTPQLFSAFALANKASISSLVKNFLLIQTSSSHG